MPPIEESAPALIEPVVASLPTQAEILPDEVLPESANDGDLPHQVLEKLILSMGTQSLPNIENQLRSALKPPEALAPLEDTIVIKMLRDALHAGKLVTDNKDPLYREFLREHPKGSPKREQYDACRGYAAKRAFMMDWSQIKLDTEISKKTYSKSYTKVRRRAINVQPGCC